MKRCNDKDGREVIEVRRDEWVWFEKTHKKSKWADGTPVDNPFDHLPDWVEHVYMMYHEDGDYWTWAGTLSFGEELKFLMECAMSESSASEAFEEVDDWDDDDFNDDFFGWDDDDFPDDWDD